MAASGPWSGTSGVKSARGPSRTVQKRGYSPSGIAGTSLPLVDEARGLLGDAWEQLPPAFDAAGAALGMTADEAAESVGLLLEPVPERWSYDTTPRNSLTFASTGGDSVHYSVLTDAGRPGPVVMTVPMNPDRPNVVVGADLRDFLALGCHSGTSRWSS
jgi:hypothetical protein